jgi:hypothetical protein
MSFLRKNYHNSGNGRHIHLQLALSYIQITCVKCYKHASNVHKISRLFLIHDIEVNPRPPLAQILTIITRNCHGLGNIEKT